MKSMRIIFLFILVVIGLYGCGSVNVKWDEKASLAQELLEKKYKEGFVVYSVGGSLSKGPFRALVYPETDSTLRFHAEVTKEGVLSDDYVSKKVAQKIQHKIMNNLTDLNMKVALKVEPIFSSGDLTNANLRVEEYFKMYPSSTFALYLVLGDKDLSKEEAETITRILQDRVMGVEGLQGDMEVFVGTEKMIYDFDKYNRENPGADRGMYETIELAPSKLFGINNGVLEMNADELVTLFN